jgi:hypothetical protein
MFKSFRKTTTLDEGQVKFVNGMKSLLGMADTDLETQTDLLNLSSEMSVKQQNAILHFSSDSMYDFNTLVNEFYRIRTEAVDGYIAFNKLMASSVKSEGKKNDADLAKAQGGLEKKLHSLTASNNDLIKAYIDWVLCKPVTVKSDLKMAMPAPGKAASASAGEGLSESRPVFNVLIDDIISQLESYITETGKSLSFRDEQLSHKKRELAKFGIRVCQEIKMNFNNAPDDKEIRSDLFILAVFIKAIEHLNKHLDKKGGNFAKKLVACDQLMSTFGERHVPDKPTVPLSHAMAAFSEGASELSASDHSTVAGGSARILDISSSVPSFLAPTRAPETYGLLSPTLANPTPSAPAVATDGVVTQDASAAEAAVIPPLVEETRVAATESTESVPAPKSLEAVPATNPVPSAPPVLTEDVIIRGVATVENGAILPGIIATESTGTLPALKALEPSKHESNESGLISEINNDLAAMLPEVANGSVAGALPPVAPIAAGNPFVVTPMRDAGRKSADETAAPVIKDEATKVELNPFA